MRTAIRQVAKRAGVSPMTVSNVIRQRPGQMSEETRRRVLDAIEELNYIPVRTSAQNRHVATNAIGVVFLQDMQGYVGYPTFQGMCERAKQMDHDLTIFLRSEPDWVKPGTEAQFLDRRCDGFIFVGPNRTEISEALVRHRIPVVECYSVTPPAGVARVVGDNYKAMWLSVEQMAAHGHRRIAHLGGPHWSQEAKERLAGYRAAMKHYIGSDGDALVVNGETWGIYQVDGVTEAQPEIEAVLSLNPTAVVCANDMMALDLWRTAEARGLRVPEDLSITGMDNIQEANLLGLTSVAVSFEQIGRLSVDAVLLLQEGGTIAEASHVLPVELISRRSVAPPKSN